MATFCMSSTSSRLLQGSSNGNLQHSLGLHPRPASPPQANPEGRNLRSTAFLPGISVLKLGDPPRRTPARRPPNTSACVNVSVGPPPGPSPGGRASLASLAIAIAIPVASGTLASLFNSANTDWYNRLRKPSWNPPSWLFGAAWGVLYAVMGFASWLIWMQGAGDAQGHALSLYVLQLLLNLAWPALFFGAKRIRLALVDIVALWLSILACIRAFQGLNLLAARLLYPYLAWVSFATILNYKYLELNSV